VGSLRAKASEVPPAKFAAGTGLEVFLEGTCLGLVAEGNGHFDLPWRELGSMRHMSTVVIFKPLFGVDGAARVDLLRFALTHKAIAGATVNWVKLRLYCHILEDEPKPGPEEYICTLELLIFGEDVLAGDREHGFTEQVVPSGRFQEISGAQRRLQE